MLFAFFQSNQIFREGAGGKFPAILSHIYTHPTREPEFSWAYATLYFGTNRSIKK